VYVVEYKKNKIKNMNGSIFFQYCYHEKI